MLLQRVSPYLLRATFRETERAGGMGKKTQGEEGQVTGGDTGVWGRSERLWPVWGEMAGGLRGRAGKLQEVRQGWVLVGACGGAHRSGHADTRGGGPCARQVLCGALISGFPLFFLPLSLPYFHLLVKVLENPHLGREGGERGWGEGVCSPGWEGGLRAPRPRIEQGAGRQLL